MSKQESFESPGPVTTAGDARPSTRPDAEDEIHRLHMRLEGAEAEIRRLSRHDEWRRIAQGFTPGGSEFQTPREVEAYMHQFKRDAHEARLQLARKRGPQP